MFSQLKFDLVKYAKKILFSFKVPQLKHVLRTLPWSETPGLRAESNSQINLASQTKKKKRKEKRTTQSIYQAADADSLNNLAQKMLQTRPLLDKREMQLGLRLDLF